MRAYNDMRLEYYVVPWLIDDHAFQGYAYSCEPVFISLRRCLYRIFRSGIFSVLVGVMDGLVNVPMAIGVGLVIYTEVRTDSVGTERIFCMISRRVRCMNL